MSIFWHVSQCAPVQAVSILLGVFGFEPFELIIYHVTYLYGSQAAELLKMGLFTCIMTPAYGVSHF